MGKTSYFLMLILIGALGSCGPNILPEKEMPSRNTFGQIDRKPLRKKNLKYPFTTIGKLLRPDKGECSAALIAENLILTSAHCVTRDRLTIDKGIYKFALGYDRGKSLAISSVKHIWAGAVDYKEPNRHLDWAILKLDKPLGKTFGYLKIKPLVSDSSEDNNDLIQAGYGHQFSNGMTMTIHKGCSIRRHLEGGRILYHDCDISKGDSGSPLFQCTQDHDCSIRAIVAAQKSVGPYYKGDVEVDYYSDDWANIAVNSSNFYEEFKKIRESIKKGD